MSTERRSPLEVLERKRSILQEHIDNAEHRVASLELARADVEEPDEPNNGGPV